MTRPQLNILIACEREGKVRQAFRMWHDNVLSCDLEPDASAIPSAWHVHGSVAPLLALPWDCIIAFPPCTHLASSGARWFPQKRADGRQDAGKRFFMSFVNATRHVPYVAIENPIGIMSTAYRKPDQIIQPWQFGHGETKATCLWLKGLRPLEHTDVVPGRHPACWLQGPSPDRARKRSETYQGIAEAMADQWSGQMHGQGHACRSPALSRAIRRFTTRSYTYQNNPIHLLDCCEKETV